MGGLRSRVAVVALLATGVVVSLAAAGSAAAPTGRWLVHDLGARVSLETGDGSLTVDPHDVVINERGQVAGTRTLGGHSRAFLWADGRLRDLGVLPGDTDSYVVDMNDRGEIVGVSYTSAHRGSGIPGHAFLWENGRMRDLGVLPGSDASEPVAINERGQIAGSTTHDLGMADRAVVWQQGRRQSLGTLGGAVSWAASINDTGQIVGAADTSEASRVAFLWQKGKMRSLGLLPGDAGSWAVGINERGQVIGVSQGDLNRPFIWQNGKMRPIQRMPRTQSTEPWIWEPVLINDRGQVALNGADEWILWRAGAVDYRGKGEAEALNERGQVAIADWDGSVPRTWENGKVTRLPLLHGDEGGAAIDLNERDQVVGLSGSLHVDNSAGPMMNSTWECHVVLWTWQR